MEEVHKLFTLFSYALLMQTTDGVQWSVLWNGTFPLVPALAAYLGVKPWPDTIMYLQM